MAGLAAAAAALVAPGKGILAADGTDSTLSWRLAAAGVAATPAGREAYREMLVTAPGLADGIGGVILAAETLRQRLPDGRLIPAALAGLGMMTGIKADAGTGPLAGAPGEPVTEGLDGILARLRGCAGLGAQFATWRAVLRIGPGMPSALAIRANAHALARYAGACQEAGLVPIVEPAVLMNGSASLGRCATVTSLVLLEVMTSLDEYGVDFSAVVLRPSMVLPGDGGSAAPAEVAEATLGALGSLPAALAGVAFLSGVQRPQQATENLAAMQGSLQLWPLTFAFGRALADPALAAWAACQAAAKRGSVRWPGGWR